jgi:hypothetical protein
VPSLSLHYLFLTPKQHSQHSNMVLTLSEHGTMWYVHGNTVNIQIFNELTWKYVINRKNECGFCYKNYSRSNSLYSMVHQVFFPRRGLAKISDEAEINGDFFRTK